MAEKTPEVPEGSVLRDDGCVCPAPPKPKKECGLEFNSCPYDPRYPNTNATRRCFFSFIDYQRCVRLLGDYPGCSYFLKCYQALCPFSWTDKWFQQMENGTFPRRIYPPKPIIYPGPGDTCVDTSEDEPPPPPRSSSC